MLLELKNIKKRYQVQKGFFGKSKSFVPAVDDVSLMIEKGENTALVGESGCGKTTLARIILKLIPYNSGSIYYRDKDVTAIVKEPLKEYRRQVQMVFQDPYSSLDPRFAVRNIIREAMTLHTDKYRTEAEQELRIIEVLKAVGLDHTMLDRYPHEFSGGERQRIAIARSVVMNPKLLILDEAVSSLDVIIQEQLINLLLDLRKRFDLTYLFISHNLKVVKKISQKIAVMFRGRIVEMAQTEEIFNNPLHPYTKELLSAAVEYKSVKRQKDIELGKGALLVDRGNGHFVLE